MAQGLGAFTEGLQGGIKARNDMDYAKQRKRYMSDKNDENDREWANREALDKSTYDDEHGGDMSGYTPAARSKIKDPALLRLGKFVGGRIKGFFGGKGGEDTGAIQSASFVSPEIAAPVQQPTSAIPQAPGTGGIPGQTDQVPQQFADGGIVEEDRIKAIEDQQRAQAAESTAALNRRGAGEDAGGLRGFGEDLGRATAARYDDTRQVALEADKDVYSSYDALRNSESAAEAGGHFTDWAGDSAKAGLATGVAVAKDTFLDNPVTDFVGGMFGFDGKGGDESAIPTPDASNESDVQAAGAAIDAPDTSSKDIADAAMSEGEQLAVENLDYQLLAEQGVSPDELPSMNTKDWSDHRYNIFRSEMDRGVGVKEAYEAMDAATVDMQMKGMMREMDKANIYLQGGNNEAAALALRQGYQYFPNGVDVKFGTAVDPKTGQPAIITMGYDEESGEPSGEPFLITSERLAAMRENFTNPKAFRAWTKDGHDLQIEVSKMQSQDDYRQGTLDINAYRAETEREDMLTSGIPGSGMKATDVDRRAGIYGERLEMIALDDPRLADSLENAMAIYGRMMQVDTSAAKDAVMEAYETGEIEGVEALMDTLR